MMTEPNYTGVPCPTCGGPLHVFPRTCHLCGEPLGAAVVVSYQGSEVHESCRDADEYAAASDPEPAEGIYEPLDPSAPAPIHDPAGEVVLPEPTVTIRRHCRRHGIWLERELRGRREYQACPDCGVVSEGTLDRIEWGADYWHAHEIEGHGFAWEITMAGQFVATIEPADGRGQVGRDRVLAYVGFLTDPTAAADLVTFHTLAEWEADGPCLVCGAYGGDHDPGCMNGPAPYVPEHVVIEIHEHYTDGKLDFDEVRAAYEAMPDGTLRLLELDDEGDLAAYAAIPDRPGLGV